MTDDEIELLIELAGQTCGVHGERNDLDSCAISCYADLLRKLAKLGHVTIVSDVGRRVIADWKGK